MTFDVKIVADSVANDIRITTMQLKYPRFIHSELMTHRMFSRNASSSRAIPISKIIEQVEDSPAMPIHWGKNKAGMQASEELPPHIANGCRLQWERAAVQAAHLAESLEDIGLHKQITNRILEPFQWISVIVTATEWDNFFALRCHPAAQPEIQHLATLMQSAMNESEPYDFARYELAKYPHWHLPYVDWKEEREIGIDKAIKCSIARCARVSYLNHDQSKPDIQKDLELADKLISMGHMSPTEHQATPMRDPMTGQHYAVVNWELGVTHCDKSFNLWSGNFRGWVQYRQLL